MLGNFQLWLSPTAFLFLPTSLWVPPTSCVVKGVHKCGAVCTGTLSVYDLVFDLTGIDLTTTTKEDLHKETMERSASAIVFTPEVQEVMQFMDCVWITCLLIQGDWLSAPWVKQFSVWSATHLHCLVCLKTLDMDWTSREGFFGCLSTPSPKDIREDYLYVRVIDQHVCFFYIQPTPSQWTVLDLIILVCIF